MSVKHPQCSCSPGEIESVCSLSYPESAVLPEDANANGRPFVVPDSGSEMLGSGA